MNRLVKTAAVLLGSILLAAHAAANDGWNQWRGPQRDGRSPGEAWPSSFDSMKTSWRVPLGKGYPGPVVAEKTVFVVETVDTKTVAVRALDRASGEERWRQSWPGKGKVPFFAASNGDWVRSTPGYDGERLYVGDMQEVLRALDAATGEVLWEVDFPATFETGVPDFGFASSPMVDGNALFVQAANSLVKLDTETGETVWRALQGSGNIAASGAFSSPVIATVAGERQLIVLSRHTLYGVNPETGAELWSHDVPNFRGMNILTPVVYGDSIFTSPYKGRSYLYSLQKKDGTFEISESWTNKATAYMSSPVVIGDHLYMHLGNGRIDCIDLRTGESRWRSNAFGKYQSMVFRDDKILALDETGWLYLFRASPVGFELLDSRQVSEQPSWGHLAVSGDQLFVRELEGVIALDWRE